MDGLPFFAVLMTLIDRLQSANDPTRPTFRSSFYPAASKFPTCFFSVNGHFSLTKRLVVDWFTEYATGYYTDQEKKCLGIQPDLTQNAVVNGNGGNGMVSAPPTPAYCEYTYSEPTSGSGKSGALTPVSPADVP
jgi:hypothetical protein